MSSIITSEKRAEILAGVLGTSVLSIEFCDEERLAFRVNTEYEYLVLNEEEAFEWAKAALEMSLPSIEPETLIDYIDMPDNALPMLECFVNNTEYNEAREVLELIVDTDELTRETISTEGYRHLIGTAVGEFKEKSYGKYSVYRI